MKEYFKKLVTIGMMLFISTTLYRKNEAPAPEPVAAVEEKTIYLQTSEDWRQADAWFAAWVWSNDTNGVFFKLTETEDDEVYSVSLPVTPYNHIIFTRMNPTYSTASWDYRWNQTSDLVLDFTSDNDIYRLTPGLMGQNEHGDDPGREIGFWDSSRPIVIEPEPDPDTDIEPSAYTIHYWRNDNKQSAYDMWLWSPGESGRTFNFKASKSILGKTWRTFEIASTDFKDPRYLNLIIKLGDWAEQTPDMQIDVTQYPIEMDGELPRRNFYLVDMETTVYSTVEDAIGDKVLKAEFTKEKEITITTYQAPASYELLIDGAVNKTATVSTTEQNYKHQFSFPIDENVDVTKKYEISVTFKSGNTKAKTIGLEGIYNTPFFENNLSYDGRDLGVTYTAQQTKFKVWAPTSSDLKINLYENGTPVSVDKVKGSDVIKETLQMVRGEKGTWEVNKAGDLHGLYYTLVSTNADVVTELIDPYAKASGVNGIRGMIVDFSKTNPTGWENVDYSVKKPTEIIPYELHVSDLTADESWNGTEAYRKNFLGLIQKGTTYQKDSKAVKTGFDHILELGVNAVQILPFYDQQNDETSMEFNWGYNPQNYNVLEGGYSSDPYNGLVRINEFKRVIQAYAAHDIRIIMDVVYNHVANISQHSFTKLVPGYYFRFDANGGPDNSSGVGNVTASERIMMERYMRDSTAFWASEYKIGGFRFDLMGLHTMKAMSTLSSNLKTIRDDIVVYGEPWNMDRTGLSDLAIQNNIHKMTNVGAFSDAGRDAIKGGSWADEARPGWIQVAGQDVDKVIDATMGKISGSGNNNPSQVVNYISVHDNYTIYDHLKTANRISKFNFGEERIRAQALQAEAISLTSQGISFLHAGSELLRSKPVEGGAAGYYDHNSYQSSYALNSIKWADKWDNLDYFNSYRQLIALKRYSQAFNYSTRSLVDTNSTAQKIANNFIKLTYKNGDDNYTIHHHGAGSARATVTDLTDREVVLDTSGSLKRGEKLTNKVYIAVNTTLITRNVRARGANDLTWPVMTETFEPPIVGPVDPVDPIDPVDPVDPIDPVDPGTSEPGTIDPNSEGETEPEEEPGLSTGAIIGISVGGGSVTIGGIALLLFKILRKKPL